MENVITRSKFVNETISIVFDFSDQIRSGESISSCTIVVSLFTGADSDPSTILYQAPLITGNTVNQKFRLGVPGCIYEIYFLITGSLGTHAEKVTNLAILPQDGIAIPSFTVIYETSCLYPYELSDSLRSGITFVRGFQGYTIPPEALSSSITFVSGVTAGTVASYSNPPEYLSSNIGWISGVLAGNSVSYSNPPEDLSSNIAWLSGIIGGTGIQYAIPQEGLSSGISWFSGSIT
jgi:hypothetical protein